MSDITAKDNKHIIRDFLSSEGDLGEMIRKFNWATTPLGPLDHWSQSLKTTVNLMLNSTNPIWMGWGPDNTFLYNDAYIEVLGIDKHGWALGKPAKVVWEEIWDFCGPLSDKVYDESKSSSVRDSELFMKRGDFLEETFFSFTYTPVFDESGNVGGLFCANFETTDKILSARRSKTLSELAAKSLVEKTIESACATVADTLSRNKADVPCAVIYLLDKNAKRAEIIQRIGLDENSESIFPAIVDLENPDSAAANPVMREIISTGTTVVVPVTKTGVLPNGLANQPVTHTIGIPLALSGSKPLGVIIFGINPTRKLDGEYSTFFEMVAGQVSNAIQNATAIETERKRLEELAELDAAKTVFFSNISHEFRTPLTLMLGPLEELLNNYNLGLQERQIAETTHRNAMRLLKLVNTLLEFSLIESGRMKAQFVPTDIARFTENLAGSFRSVIEKAGMQLDVKVEKLSEVVYADRQMWEKIVFNLLSNAFKYTLEGKIAVRVTQDTNNAILKVTDTGLGIPEKELGNMFSRFHRIQNISGRSYEGSGIGLSMIKELITQHGGTINVESKEGVGSTFTVTIPFGKNHLPEGSVAEESSHTDDISDSFVNEAKGFMSNRQDMEINQEEVRGVQETVLIIDDNNDMRKHLQSIIEKEYNVLTAGNGLEALNIIKEQMPSIVVSDIMMPVMDGIQLLRELKTSPSTATLPVILLTARAGEESRIEGYETGADDYLVKPFSAKELLARIRSQIKLSNTRDHYRQQLKNLFMQAPMAIAILKGEDMVIELANENILGLWGKTHAEVMDKPLAECLPEAVEQGFDKLLQSVYNTGESHINEEAPFYNLKDGANELMYIKFIYQPYYEEDGSISGVIVLAHNVTQQVVSRKKVEESEAKFRNLIKQAPTGIVILKGEDLVVEMANDIYGKIVDKTRDELLGKPLIATIPQLKNTPVESNLKQVYNTGHSYKHIELPVEMNIAGKSDTHYYSSVYQPLYENNEITGVIAVVNEVTEQFLARKVKEKNDEDLKLILETMPHIAFRANPEGMITYFNNKYTEYTGMSFEEARDTGWQLTIEPSQMQEVYDSWMHSMQTGEDYDFSFMMRRGDDKSYRWHLSRAVALRNEQGEISQWVGTMIDIHERKVFTDNLEAMVHERTMLLNRTNVILAQKNGELEQSNKELESFNYIASHDLQEPLRKIRTFINMINEKGRDHANFGNYMAKIDSSAERMSQLINAVLSYSRLSSAGDNFVRADLNEILQQVINDFELRISERSVTIEYDRLPVINCLPTQINQLFSNLISNAIKYSKEDPVIQVRYHEISGHEITNFKVEDENRIYAELRFIDNGIGFEKEYSEQIFKLFQRLHGKTEYSGTGIGLSICKKIVDKHDGFIWAESATGKGSTFIILLPLEH